MKYLARKKIVLVIVEGPSDNAALGVMLNQVYDKDSVYVYIMHGDITTRTGVTSQNIISKIGNEVRGYAKSHHYTAKDFKQIIQMVRIFLRIEYWKNRIVMRFCMNLMEFTH